ncbi:MAG: type VI secretion system-associated FHA domain protein TagH [Gammaproteobacteria bacterium]|nr:type VI secretion system-associated FHA domain protein TagH [Gammaproteobacteria bacterium]
MSLTLTIVNQPSVEPGQVITMTIEQHATIGRAISNDWVLLDKSRYISGKHGSVEKVNDVYQITDTSTNGIYLNGNASPIGNGGVAVLKNGDQLLIGEFEISVRIEQDIAFNDKPVPLNTNASPIVLAPESSVDPLCFFPPSTPENANIPIPASSNQTPYSPGHNALDPLNGLNNNTPPTHSEGDHASPLQEPFQPPNAIPDQSEAIPNDWAKQQIPDMVPQDPIEAVTPESHNGSHGDGHGNTQSVNILPDNYDIIPTATTPPTPQMIPAAQQADTPPTASAKNTEQHQATMAENNNALHAFLTSLGIPDLNIPENDVPAFMRDAGLMLRQTIQSSLSILRARSNIKSGFRMSMTTIQAVENNPLKFSITLDDAINNMFTNRSNSYLHPVQALQEGFRDIENHQLAVMAGMQSALKALIEQFDPNTLESMFKQDGVGGKFLAGNKKASYWDAYATHFKQIAKHVEDDFQTVFGDEFSKAYETQIAKLNIMKK